MSNNNPEKEFEMTGSWLKTLFSEMKLGAILVDSSNMNIIDYNENFNELVLYRKNEELRENNVFQIIPQKIFNQILTGDKYSSGKTYILNSRLEKIPVLLSITKINKNNKKYYACSFFDISEQEKTEREYLKKSAELDARVRELKCLFEISKLIEKPVTLKEILAKAANELKPAMLEPDNISVRIRFKNIVVQTEGFIESEWKLSSSIIVRKEELGSVNVFFNSNEQSKDGILPFLSEEIDLIHSVSKQIGVIIEKIVSEKIEIKRNNQLTFLTYCAMDFLRLSKERSVYKTMLNHIKMLEQDSAIFIYTRKNHKGPFSPKSIYVPEGSQKEEIIKILKKSYFNLDKEKIIEINKSLILKKTSNYFYNLVKGSIGNKKVKLPNSCFVLNLKDEVFISMLVFILKENKSLKNSRLLLTYKAQISQAIKKRIAEEKLEEINMELVNSNNSLKEAQAKLIHQEKLASIGLLAAGLAHELNNPIGFVSSNFRTLIKYKKLLTVFIDDLIELVKENCNSEVMNKINDLHNKMDIKDLFRDWGDIIKESEEGFNRVISIVNNLRSFSRVDKSKKLELYDMNTNLENTLIIARNEVKYVADVETDFSEIPTIMCHGDEINQVFLNIIVNAAQAIKEMKNEKKGIIKIRTYQEASMVCCEIKDNGPGIPDEIIDKIFDPFFTTKETGKGTGLGLNISYDIIVNKHSGDLLVNSSLGKGTVFTIKLPVNN